MAYQTVEQAYSIYATVARRRYMDNAVPLSFRNPHAEDYVISGYVNYDGVGVNYYHTHSLERPVACGSNMDDPQGRLCNLQTGTSVQGKSCEYNGQCPAGMECKSGFPGGPKQCRLETCRQDSDSSSGICNTSDKMRGLSLPYRAEPLKCKKHQDCSSGLCLPEGLCSRPGAADHPTVLHVASKATGKYRGMY